MIDFNFPAEHLTVGSFKQFYIILHQLSMLIKHMSVIHMGIQMLAVQISHIEYLT